MSTKYTGLPEPQETTDTAARKSLNVIHSVKSKQKQRLNKNNLYMINVQIGTWKYTRCTFW